MQKRRTPFIILLLLSALTLTSCFFSIHDAARRGDTLAIKKYIENGGAVNAKNKYEQTALMMVRNVKTAKLLIDNGADVNAIIIKMVKPH